MNLIRLFHFNCYAIKDVKILEFIASITYKEISFRIRGKKREDTQMIEAVNIVRSGDDHKQDFMSDREHRKK